MEENAENQRRGTLAWLHAPGGRSFFARAECGSLATATCRLVAGIQRVEGWDSLRVLRSRIHTTAAPNDLDARIVQVSAKRLTFSADPAAVDLKAAVDLSAAQVGDPSADRTAAVGGEGLRLTPAQAIAACNDLAASVPLEPDRFISSRPVGALVLDEGGGLVGAAVNTNVIHRLLHAELNLVFQRFAHDRIPAGATVYTSLSPCRMCAALLAAAAADGGGLRVVALSKDPGRYGRQASVKTEIWDAAWRGPATSVPAAPPPR